MTDRTPGHPAQLLNLTKRALGALRRWALPRPSDVAPRALAAKPALPERVSIENQTLRATGYVYETIERTQQLSVMQELAAEHLDGASYALERLFIELAPAMHIPGRTLAPVVARIEPKRFERPERPAAIAA